MPLPNAPPSIRLYAQECEAAKGWRKANISQIDAPMAIAKSK